MNSRLMTAFGVIVAANMAGLGVQGVSAQTPRVPAGVDSSFDMVEAPVLKVFSAADDGHRFVAYQVKWKGSDVIVSDPLAQSTFKVGDRIRFMAHRITIRRPAPGTTSLGFTLLESGASMRGGVAPSVSSADQKRLMRITQGDI